jgi:hypothetical protein
MVGRAFSRVYLVARAASTPLPPEQWQFMAPDKYPVHISRDTYETIQAILRDNYQEYHRRRSRGVARSGAALLQGLGPGQK